MNSNRTIQNNATAVKTALGCIVLASALFSASAQAVWMRMDIVGDIIDADVGNIFGLSVGDTITGEAIYDDATLSGGGFEELSFGAGTCFTMTFNIGGIVFTETHDQNYASGNFPTLAFDDGAFAGYDYAALYGVNGSPANLGAGLDQLDPLDADFGASNGDDSSIGVLGTWRTPTFTVLGVPEPTTLGLSVVALTVLPWTQHARKRQESK